MQQSLSRILEKRELFSVMDFTVQAMKSIGDEDHLKLLSSLKKIVPVEKCCNMLSCTDKDGQFKSFKKIVTANYPDVWLNIYLESGYVKVDPVLRQHFRYFSPQIWSKTFSSSRGLTVRRYIEHAVSFGLGRGVTVGTRSTDTREASLLSFHGCELEEEQRHLAVLDYLTPFLHHSLTSLCRPHGQIDVDFSKREKEVVRWIVSGKTNWEISLILNVSESTVKYHINHAMKKLAATSRSHLAAIAIQRDLVEL